MPAVRAVLDTNVVVAGHRTMAPASPNREIFARWKAGDFTLLYSEDLLVEYVEKLIAHGVSRADLREFVAAISRAGERVAIQFFHLRRYPLDSDDIIFLLCAMNGNATHLVSYDAGFEPFAGEFAFAICEPLDFLAALRAGGRD